MMETAMNSVPAYDKILAIGLGGSGVRAVRSFMLYGSPGPAGLAPYDRGLAHGLERSTIVPIAIDTDADDLEDTMLLREAYPRALQSEFDNGRLPGAYPEIRHRIVVRRDEIGAALDLARSLERQRQIGAEDKFGDASAAARLIDEYLPISRRYYDALMPAGQDAAEGAGQLRALGRIAFLCSLDEIYDTFKQAVVEIQASGQKGQRARIVLFSSIAGGTGAGMLLDTAILLRRVIAPSIPLSAHLLLPDVFMGVSGVERIWPNCFATLKELDTISRPANSRPIRINYRIRSEDKKVTIHKQDDAIIDSLYLYDDTAKNLDWDPDPHLREDAELRAASRAMADVALALARSDIRAANKNKQNLLVGLKSGTAASRRIYHTAAVAPLRPEATRNLAGVVSVAVLEWLRRTCIDPLVIDSPPPSLLRQPDRIATTLQATPEANGASDQADTGTGLAPWELALESYVEHLRQIADDPSFDNLVDLERDPDLDALNAWIGRNFRPNIIEKWREGVVQQSRQEADRPNGATDPSSPVVANVAKHEIFRDVIDERLRPLTDYLDELEGRLKQETARHLSPIVGEQLDEVREWLSQQPEETTADDMVEITAPNSFYHQRITLGAYREGSRQSDDRLREWYPPGPLRRDMATMARTVVSAIENGLRVETEDGFELRPELPGQVARAYMRGPFRAEIGSRIDRLALINLGHRSYVDGIAASANRHALDVAGYVNLIAGEDEVQRFERVMAPLHELMTAYRQAQDRTDRHDLERIKLHDLMRRRLQERFDRLGPDPDRNAHLAHDILGDLVDRLGRQSDGAIAGKVSLVETVAEILASRVLTGLTGEIEMKNIGPADLAPRLQNLHETAIAFIEFFLEQSEFELSRVGGPTGLEATVDNCRLGVFNSRMAPGEMNAAAVTVALPAAGDREKITNSALTREIRRSIRARLQMPAHIADYRSDVPVIMHEHLYHAGYQLKRIDRYNAAYRALSNEEKPLYHVIPGAVGFPDSIFGTADLFEETIPRTWHCHGHGEHPVDISGSDDHCPVCVDEHARGRRRLIDVSRRSPWVDLVLPECPGTKAKQPFPPVAIPQELQSRFWNGPDNSELSRLDGGGTFETLLLANGFAEGGGNGATPPKASDRRLFPAVFDERNKVWEWLQRDPYRDNRFVRYRDQALRVGQEVRLYECFHCGFPINQTIGSAVRPTTCPRCRRALEHCGHCSDHRCQLYEPSFDSGAESKRCPSCEFDMNPPIFGPEPAAPRDDGGDGPDPTATYRGGGGSQAEALST